eukprot:SAG31_NODE_4696_length_3026_cov_3.073454_1_plen_65_part_10
MVGDDKKGDQGGGCSAPDPSRGPGSFPHICKGKKGAKRPFVKAKIPDAQYGAAYSCVRIANPHEI